MAEAEILTTAPEPPPILPTPVSDAAPELQAPPTGQLILGTDKRNPVFTVYEDRRCARAIPAWHGLCLA